MTAYNQFQGEIQGKYRKKGCSNNELQFGSRYKNHDTHSEGVGESEAHQTSGKNTAV